MKWKEVRKRLARGARLVCTNELPGGWCFALCHAAEHSPGWLMLMRVRELPPWVGVPNPFDPRSIRAALEMSISRDS